MCICIYTHIYIYIPHLIITCIQNTLSTYARFSGIIMATICLTSMRDRVLVKKVIRKEKIPNLRTISEQPLLKTMFLLYINSFHARNNGKTPKSENFRVLTFRS